MSATMRLTYDTAYMERCQRDYDERMRRQREYEAEQADRARRERQDAPDEAIAEYLLRQTVECYGSPEQYALLVEALGRREEWS